METRSHNSLPYLSVVIAARNDNHGGNMLVRMQAMLDSWIVQAERYGLNSEIVIVEWNPPRDRPRLKESLQWPLRPSMCEVRFIEVPPATHASFRNSAAIGLHQMIAKNVGIRRSHGEYVLATNLDIICSADLMRFFARHKLIPGVMYRMDRYDVSRDLPPHAPIDDLLEFCATHRLRLFAREGDFQLSAEGVRLQEADDIAPNDSGVHFGAGWSPVESSMGERYRWVGSEAELWIEPRGAGTRGIRLSAEVGPSAGFDPVAIEIADEKGSLLAEGEARGRCQLQAEFSESAVLSGRLLVRTRGRNLPLSSHPRIVNLRVFSVELHRQSHPQLGSECRGSFRVIDSSPAFDWATSFSAPSPHANQMKNSAHLHANAAGDFTLLSRENWFALRGYAEFPIWPMHVDYLLCYSAHHAGIHESILDEPMRIYHVEHSAGAGWTPEGEQERATRVRRSGVPEMTHKYVARFVDVMRRYDAPVLFNDAHWGLGDRELAEQSVWPLSR